MAAGLGVKSINDLLMEAFSNSINTKSSAGALVG
jgi:hypothetical protein